MRMFSSLRISHGDLVPKFFQCGSGSVLPALLLFLNSGGRDYNNMMLVT